MRRTIIAAALLCTTCVLAVAQQPQPAGVTPQSQAVVSGASDSKEANGNLAQSKLVATAPKMTEESLPSGARIYVAPVSNGFDTYIIAGIQKKNVPVAITTNRDTADYELTGVSESDKAGWAKMLFIGSQQSNETASIKLVNLKSGNVVFAYSVNKTNSVRGKQSAGEAVAKHIKEKIESKH
jgi:hypothetical protein